MKAACRPDSWIMRSKVSAIIMKNKTKKKYKKKDSVKNGDKNRNIIIAISLLQAA